MGFPQFSGHLNVFIGGIGAKYKTKYNCVWPAIVSCNYIMHLIAPFLKQ